MAPSLFDRIRTATAAVCAAAEHVTIATERIEAYATSLDVAALQAPRHDPASHVLDQGEATMQFFVVLDSINFGSGYFPYLDKLPGKSGYFTVAGRLAERYRRQGPFTCEALSAMTAAEAAALFGQRPDNAPATALMALFARALRDLGRLLREGYRGSAVALIEAAGHQAEELCRRLAAMVMFRDEQPYRGMLVPFYKRAQLMAADLAVACGNRGPGRFDDLDRLTVFADNLVPHVLRLDGLLQLDAATERRIATGRLLAKDEPAEVELRAATVQTVERLARVFRDRGVAVTPLELDFLLWNRGQQPRYKAVPRPRCRTWFY